MADCSIPSTRSSRLIRRGLMTCAWFIAVVIIYVASIGPLAWLNSRGFGNDETWKQLHKTVYRPVFYVWWYGPRTVSNALGWYVDLFNVSSYLDRNPRYFTKRYNKMGRLARIKYQIHSEQLGELTIGDLDEWHDSRVVFSLAEAEYDQFLCEHAAKEFQR